MNNTWKRMKLNLVVLGVPWVVNLETFKPTEVRRVIEAKQFDGLRLMEKKKLVRNAQTTEETRRKNYGI